MTARDVLCDALSEGTALPPEQWITTATELLSVLNTAGYAVVDLPKPDGPLGRVGNEPKGLAWRRVTDPDAEAGGVATVAVSGWSSEVIAAISCLRTPDDARWAAAALLAAADAAEAT